MNLMLRKIIGIHIIVIDKNEYFRAMDIKAFLLKIVDSIFTINIAIPIPMLLKINTVDNNTFLYFILDSKNNTNIPLIDPINDARCMNSSIKSTIHEKIPA
jgi:hypothetical protein